LVCVVAFSASAFGQGQRVTKKMMMQGESLTTVTANSGGVAQSGVPAAIYRSTGCGFQSWIGGQPSWLDEWVLFNDGGNGAQLRSMNFPMCYDTCHRGGRCPGQGGPADCGCLAAGFGTITSNFQVYDGDPCGAGVAIAGAGGSVDIVEGVDILTSQIFDGSSNCFNLTVTIDPKVVIPHDAWVEANYGHDDGWPLTGRPNDLEGQGESPLSGLNDGVDCVTQCDNGDPNLCSNDSDRCDWIRSNADTNAELFFTLQPRSGGAGPVVGQEIILTKGGVRVDMDIFVSDFDPGQTGVLVQAYQSGLDSSGYTSALKGTLTPVVIACAGDGDCNTAATMGPGSKCNGISSTCEAGYISLARADFLLAGGAVIAACNVSTQDYVCGGTFLSGGNATTGADAYLWSVAVDVSPLAKGTFTVDLQLPPNNVLLTTNAQFLPLAGIVAGQVTVQTGQCCDLSGGAGNFVCITDEITANGCAAIPGAVFNPNATCADDCGCIADSDCADGDACTVDTCDASSQCVSTKVDMSGADCCDPDPAAGDDVTGGGALTSFAGVQCFADSCDGGGNRGTAIQTATPGDPCSDGVDCETAQDTCQADGSCVGTPINSFVCGSDAECAAIDGAATCNQVTGTCRCELPELRFDIRPSDKENPNCFPAGDKVTVDVVYNRVPVPVTGAQFVVLYDPSCLSFNSISPGGAPFVLEIDEIVDQASGRIFYAVGVDPFGGPGQGVITTATLATISFTKLDNGCGECGLCFGDDKLLQTILVDDEGQTVQDIEPLCSKGILTNEVLTLDGPADVTTNVDCGDPTAAVSWDAATASSTCGTPDLVCGGVHESGKPMDDVCSGTGGDFPQGRTDCCCTASSDRCGKVAEHCWSVTVSDEQSFDLEVQLSPIIAGDLNRCIKFELFSDCVTPPVTWKQDMWFGGVWDFVGHSTPKKKLAKGQFVAMSAMDQNHTLRACAEVVGTGSGSKNCSATFKGDPFFGGNWLIGGNLDAWKVKNGSTKASYDKINILDFGMFVSQFGVIVDPNSTCSSTNSVHADINGDGMVDADDFAFIFNNFLAHSKDCVCPDGVSSGSNDIDPTDTEVSVAQLREWGLPELTVADLNDDGVVNMDDMSAFLAGETPTTKTRRVRTGSGLGSR
jgi:hypothetical protein